MSMPKITQTTLISTSDIPKDDDFGGLRIVDIYQDSAAEKSYNGNQYEIQHDVTYNKVWGTLSLKGARKGPRARDTG